MAEPADCSMPTSTATSRCSNPDEWELVLATRAFMAEPRSAPIAEQCWADAEFPHQLVPKMAELGIMGLSYGHDGTPPASRLLTGFLGLEISRVDTSIATFYGVHNGLAMGSIYIAARRSSRSGGCRPCGRWS